MEAIFGVHRPFRGILNLLVRPCDFPSEYLRTSLCACVKKIELLEWRNSFETYEESKQFLSAAFRKDGEGCVDRTEDVCDVCVRDLYTPYL
jgi:hypothetical protein